MIGLTFGKCKLSEGSYAEWRLWSDHFNVPCNKKQLWRCLNKDLHRFIVYNLRVSEEDLTTRWILKANNRRLFECDGKEVVDCDELVIWRESLRKVTRY